MATTTKMSQARIDELNAAAAAKLGMPADGFVEMSGPEAYDALMEVVRQRGLDLVTNDADEYGSCQCEVYRDPATGELVNLWVSGNSLGFDDQIDWMDEVEAD